jgi:hypothetical protein
MAPEPEQEQPVDQEPLEDVYSCSSGSSERSTSSSEGFENIEAAECLRESYDWSVQNVALESQPSWKPDHTLKVGAAPCQGGGQQGWSSSSSSRQRTQTPGVATETAAPAVDAPSPLSYVTASAGLPSCKHVWASQAAVPGQQPTHIPPPSALW